MIGGRWWSGGVLAALSAASVSAQIPVHLELKPRVGDTLRIRLDQTMEVTRQVRRQGEPNEAASLVVHARLTVDMIDNDGATMTAMADSVRVASSEGFSNSPTLRSVRAMRGARYRFRMRPDGATMLAGTSEWGGMSVGSLLTQLPATLPHDKLLPGASWLRSVELPLSLTPESKGTATLNATFRFDSLSASGDLAWLSVKGRLVRAVPLGTSDMLQTTGEVSGQLTLDLRRGWIADARSVVTLESLFAQSGKPHQRSRVKITQWMRAM